MRTLSKDVLHRFNFGFSKAIALGVIGSRELVGNAVFLAEAWKGAAELNSAVTADGARPAEKVEPKRSG